MRPKGSRKIKERFHRFAARPGRLLHLYSKTKGRTQPSSPRFFLSGLSKNLSEFASLNCGWLERRKGRCSGKKKKGRRNTMSKAVGPDLRKYMDKKLSGTRAILIRFVGNLC